MKNKTVFFLVVILAVLAAATGLIWYAGSRSSSDVRMGQAFLPGLDINAVTAIKVQAPDQTFTVAKMDGKWAVKERGGYPADFDKIIRFGRKLGALTVGRAFSHDADVLARLSMKKPGTPGASKQHMGCLFTLLDDKGGVRAEILVGKDRERMTPEGYPIPAGQYARTGDMKSVMLLDRFFETVDQSPSNWLEKSIVRVDEEKVTSVTCMDVQNGKQEVVYELTRADSSEDFSLASQEPVKKTEADKLADALSALTLDDVRQAESGEAPDGPFIDYWLDDGTRHRVYKSTEADGPCWVRLKVSHQAAVSSSPKEEDSEDGGDPAQLARELNERLWPWEFKLSSWRCKTLVTDKALLVDGGGNG